MANLEGDPLKNVINTIGELAQLVEGLELEPSKAELRSISKELTSYKTRVHSLAKTLIASDDAAVAAEAHELLGEASEVMATDQKRVPRLL
jgi:hypothetical protein